MSTQLESPPYVTQGILRDYPESTSPVPEGSLLFGFLGGVFASVVSAILWAIISALTHYQAAVMAIGVGILVGFAVRKAGHGDSPVFGLFGAGLALFGCLLGNLFTTWVMAAVDLGVPFSQLLVTLNPEVAFELLKATFRPMDVLFYVLAITTAYQCSFRRPEVKTWD